VPQASRTQACQGGGRQRVALWSTHTGKLVQHLGKVEYGTFNHVALTPDSKLLVVLDDAGEQGKGRLRFWDVATGKEVRTLKVPGGALGAFRFLLDGRRLVASDSKGQALQLLDAVMGTVVRRFPSEEEIKGFALSPDGKRVCGVTAGSAILWEVGTGKRVWQVPVLAPGREGQAAVAFSPTGRAIAVANRQAVLVLDTSTGRASSPDAGHAGPVVSVTFSSTGKALVSGSEDDTVRLWDAASGKQSRRLLRPLTPPREESSGFAELQGIVGMRCVLAPDGKAVAAVWPAGPAHVWDAVTGKLLHQLGGSPGQYCLACSPAGTVLAATGTDGLVRLWDRTTGKEVSRLTWQTRPAEELEIEEGAGAAALTFSPDGKSLAAGGLVEDGKKPGQKVVIRLWESATGALRLEISPLPGRLPQYLGDLPGMAATFDTFLLSLTFSPEGKTLAAGGFTSITLWDAATGKELRRLGGAAVRASTAAFSADGKVLAAGQLDGSVRFWDVATGTILRDFPAHEAAVTALAFAPDGKTLASAAADTTVLVWDLAQVLREAPAGRAGPDAAGLPALWNDLASADGARAYRAMNALAAPAESVPFLKERLRAVRPVAAERLAQLLADLSGERFAARQQAARELERLGELAGPALRRLAATAPSLEARRRSTALVEKLEGPVTDAELRRSLRAVEVLEHVGTREAREVLEGLARGAPGARLTQEAAASLQRLARRSAARP
jgi:WD40 repeat protein